MIFFLLLIYVLATILIIPFGIAVVYFCMSLFQLITGAKENSRIKQKGGKIAFAVSIIVMLLIMFIWRYLYFSIRQD